MSNLKALHDIKNHQQLLALILQNEIILKTHLTFDPTDKNIAEDYYL